MCSNSEQSFRKEFDFTFKLEHFQNNLKSCCKISLMNCLEFTTELKLQLLFAAIMFTWNSGMLLKVKYLRQLQRGEKK